MQNLPAQMNLAASADIFKIMIDDNASMEELQLNLLGLKVVYDEEGNKNTIRVGKAYIKEEYVNELMTFVRGISDNKSIKFTHFSEEDVLGEQHRVDCAILDLLSSNFNKWELEESNLDSVYVMLTLGTYSIIRRSLFGKTLEAFTTMTEHHESVVRQEQSKEKRIGGGF